MSTHHFSLPVSQDMASIEGLEGTLMEFRWSEKSGQVLQRCVKMYEGKKTGWCWNVMVDDYSYSDLKFPSLEQAKEGCRAWVSSQQKFLEEIQAA